MSQRGGGFLVSSTVKGSVLLLASLLGSIATSEDLRGVAYAGPNASHNPTGKSKSLEEAFEDTKNFIYSLGERLVNSVHLIILEEEDAVYIQVGDEIKEPVTEKNRVLISQLKEKLEKIQQKYPEKVKRVSFSALPSTPYNRISKVINAYDNAMSSISESFRPGDVQYIFLTPYVDQHNKTVPDTRKGKEAHF